MPGATDRGAALLLAATLLAAPVAAQQAPPPGPGLTDLPEVAVPGWLSDTVTRPHANVATSAAPPEVTVMPLGAVTLDAVGLLPGSITGLPPGLWGASEAETLARLFRAQPLQGLPAIQAFTETLALAELDPPADAAADDPDLFLARVDMLLARGALDPAQALIERAGPANPEVFRRWFDVSLLSGHADRACQAMSASPDIAPTLPARILCLARSGDWAAAALTLDTGEALGRITEAEADLIARFLDPELFEGEPPLPPDPALTPLSFQMRAAIGERPATTGLPLAFAHADLSDLAGWNAQLDAAERLTRSGAVEPGQWLAIYTARVPSASGGVWDRVAALQRLDAAILAGDAPEIAARLAPAWTAMEAAGLETAFAEIYAERLLRTPLTGEDGLLARRIGLLSSLYETVAQAAVPQTPDERFAFDVARGLPAAPSGAADLTAQAVAAAFSSDPPEHRYAWFLQNDRLGEALLRAALVLSDPARDPGDITDALTLYRAVGLEDVARRTALQLLLLRG
ncbi:hypothetical protein [Roseicyclus persicicus]|uniref:Lytic transglycosylase domain-containing protein n=1 Tax=Roseicyclus persicicus TaxID=2650661 RepID=A0A7X6H3I8_9RHOB|nr:hypothetical protein [Roseibacterium persicicum]NKX46493.1 hypothetical protein [Roseibacterium persicicum]